MKCATHPDVETDLRCGRCEKPICPRCMVMTPVGARCRECAGLYKLPTYRVSMSHYLKAMGVGLLVALAIGAIWGLIYRLFMMIIPFIYINWIFGVAAGYGCAEAISWVVNRKRGTGLAITAAVAFCISYVVGLVVPWGFYFSLFDILTLAAGIFVSVRRLR